MERENYIMKSAARFIISWFGMTNDQKDKQLHQWIMYEY